MSEEQNDVGSFVVLPEQTEQTSLNASPPRKVSKENKTRNVKISPGSTASKEKSPNKTTKVVKQKSGEAKQSPESIVETIEVRDETQETIEAADNDENFIDVKEIYEKEADKIRETHESLEETERKAKDDFVAATEHMLSSPSDLSEMVSSFENLQPIYGSEALNFRSDDENISTPNEEKDEVDDEKISKKSDVDKNIKKSPKSDESDEKDANWEMNRGRRKSSVLTDADLTRKSSEDTYPIGIPLRKKVNKSTRKKLWREIQKRKPFISANVYAHIQHFAKPPFQTWGCHNCNYRKDVKGDSNAHRNE